MFLNGERHTDSHRQIITYINYPEKEIDNLNASIEKASILHNKPKKQK